MRNIRFVAIALLALVCLGVNAKGKKTAKKVVVEKVDTATVADFSYAIGLANTQGLKQYLVQRMGIDTTYMEDFLKGFDAGTMTQEDLRMKARLSGMEIREQVENEIMTQVSKQIDDTQDLLVKPLFLQGFRNGISGEEGAISMDSAEIIIKKNLEYYHGQMMEKKYGANREAGVEYLKANAKKDSVQVTASGLQYKVLVKGDGEIPTATQRVKVNYEGTLIDGTVFDSSYKRGQPATFGCSQVIKGWTEALTMMPVGSKWEIYIPQELGYGDRESGSIPPYSTLIFTVELLEIVK